MQLCRLAVRYDQLTLGVKRLILFPISFIYAIEQEKVFPLGVKSVPTQSCALFRCPTKKKNRVLFSDVVQ